MTAVRPERHGLELTHNKKYEGKNADSEFILPENARFPPAPNYPDGPTVHHGSGPIDLIRLAELGQQQLMKSLPHSGFLPFLQASPAGHA